jgi:uncharacterized Zn-binding protein involved in type VI secretion
MAEGALSRRSFQASLSPDLMTEQRRKDIDMPGKPAARLGDPTECPKKGHTPASITSGSSDVLINGLPAARIGDQTSCGSTLAGNASSTVLINGKPALTIGSTGDHGDVIIGGSGDVIVGS